MDVMGIDCPHTHRVLHWGLPSTLVEHTRKVVEQDKMESSLCPCSMMTKEEDMGYPWNMQPPQPYITKVLMQVAD